jgi:hypothetical protein
MLFNPDRYRDATSDQFTIPFSTSDFSKSKQTSFKLEEKTIFGFG